MKKKTLFILMFLFVVGCANGRGMKVTIKPTLDNRLEEIQPLPLHVGLFIEPLLRHFNQEEWQTSRFVGIHHYVFPIGEPLAKNIEEMTKRVFSKVTILDELPSKEVLEKVGLDAILTAQLKSSRLELIDEESVLQAIGKHYLSIQVSLLDKNLNKIFDEELTAEGKHLDLIDYQTEGGWWKVAGPRYGPAVEDSIEKIVYKLAQKLITSSEQIVNK